MSGNEFVVEERRARTPFLFVGGGLKQKGQGKERRRGMVWVSRVEGGGRGEVLVLLVRMGPIPVWEHVFW